jgi:hypothetical protein
MSRSRADKSLTRPTPRLLSSASYPQLTCPKPLPGVLCDMDKIVDQIQQRCIRCGKALRPVTSMLEPKSGRIFHMYLCECGEKSWTAETK